MVDQCCPVPPGRQRLRQGSGDAVPVRPVEEPSGGSLDDGIQIPTITQDDGGPAEGGCLEGREAVVLVGGGDERGAPLVEPAQLRVTHPPQQHDVAETGRGEDAVQPGPVRSVTDEEILEKVLQAAQAAFDAKLALIGHENFTQFQRAVLLQSFDSNWRDHLAALDYLRQGIHLRGYAQKQPKQEYKREAFELFRQLIDQVKNEVTRVLMTVQVQSNEQLDQATEVLGQRAEHIANVTYTSPTEDGSQTTVRADEAEAGAPMMRVGRNDPCPCGSGLKFKQCHGKLA